MSADDIIYAPIIPADELRELIKRIMNNPTNQNVIGSTADAIIDLFERHGIIDEQEIVDAVYRQIGDLEDDTLQCRILL